MIKPDFSVKELSYLTSKPLNLAYKDKNSGTFYIILQSGVKYLCSIKSFADLRFFICTWGLSISILVPLNTKRATLQKTKRRPTSSYKEVHQFALYFLITTINYNVWLQLWKYCLNSC